MTTPTRAAAALVVAAAVMATGCTTGDPVTTPSPSVDESAAAEADDADLGGDLPPLEAADLAELYADELAELGLVLTDRGGLVDGSTYEADEDGTHLSLYVAPTGERDEDTYLDGLVDVTAVFAEDVFERWPGLASFDVCQETVPVDGEPTGLPRTQITLTRDAAAAIDWSSADVVDVDDAVAADEGSSLVLLDAELRAVARERFSP